MKLTVNQKKTVIVMSFVAAVLSLKGLTSPIMAYIQQTYPALDASTIQSLVTIPCLVGGIIGIFAGPFSQLIGRKNLLLISIATGLVYVMTFFAFGLRGPFSALLAAAYVSGVEAGFGTALVNAAIGEQFDTPEIRARWISVAMACLAIGSMLANIVGGWIGSIDNGAHWPHVYLLGLLYIPAMALLQFVLPKEKRTLASDGRREHFQISDLKGISPLLLMICLFHLVFYFGFQAYNTNYSFYIISEYGLGSSREAGFCGSLYGVGGIIVGFTYPIFQKIFKKAMVPAGYALNLLALVIMALGTRHLFCIYIAAFLVGIGINMACNYVYAAAASLCNKKMSNYSMSIVFLFMNIGQFAAISALVYGGKLLGGSGDVLHKIYAGIVYLAIAVIGSGVIFVGPFFAKSLKKRERLNAEEEKNNSRTVRISSDVRIQES